VGETKTTIAEKQRHSSEVCHYLHYLPTSHTHIYVHIHMYETNAKYTRLA